MRFSEYYAFDPRLCYPYRPQTKGKVERTIGFIRNNFFTARIFSDIPDLNRQCSEWLKNINGGVHATTGKIPAKMLHSDGAVDLDNLG